MPPLPGPSRECRPRAWNKTKTLLMAEDEPPGTVPKPLVFRADETTPEVVRSVLLERGWEAFGEHARGVDDWDLYWRASSFRMAQHVNVKPWQWLNHHPGTATLTRKDRLARQLQHMGRTYGSALYAFAPPTFVLPCDYTKFLATYFSEEQVLGARRGYWICKPSESSRGRGISIFSDIKDLIFGDTYVVQRYICNPLLVGRYKCDLRVYVCVTGFKPLTIYVYQEGLARFATEKFDLSDPQNCYAHLTNCSVNKAGTSYQEVKEVVGRGCKWTLGRFFSYLRSWDVDDLLLWQKINRLVILTVLAIASAVPFAANCFELFGFDILIDDNLKPWLLEVNYSPALSLDCPVDVVVKRRLVHDIIDLVYLTGLRNERTPVSKAANGRSSGPFTRGDRGRRGGAGRSLPCKSLLQFPGKTCGEQDSAAEEGVRACPKATPSCQPRARARQEGSLLPAGESARVKPGLRSRLPARSRSALGPCVSLVGSWTCPAEVSPCDPAHSTKTTAPHPGTGNFVLIFPFNEATLGASKDELNVKRITQELQKLMNKQRSQATGNKTQRRWPGAWDTRTDSPLRASSGASLCPSLRAAPGAPACPRAEIQFPPGAPARS
ncbi:probable tubulin polyglutamylase TTLL2 [Tupaia chinensis]|uniref:probable tubulin polyglutamylase TTLL2 n=1 Tax=Tupaia chinensis TaxID=246437 RepID=UPI0003C8E034|nr:probable tubulin polyglutamylase TTLL2 [Tupaia chinensis]